MSNPMVMNISIWDDDAHVAQDWKQKIEGLLNSPDICVKAFNVDEINHELRVLHQRREAFLSNSSEHDAESALDTTHLLIVDNDLFKLRNFSDFSAEMVATRAGVYTDCGLIVVLNLDTSLDFDLRLLGHPSSKADLHINDKFVADPGLWEQCPRKGGSFRPWHWPLLLAQAQQHKVRVDELHRMLGDGGSDEPILDFLRFPEEAKRRLSRTARAFLHPLIIDTKRVSFPQFVEGNVRAVALRDGKMITQRSDTRKVARIGARRVYKWLARLVLGPQDVLIDFPHLMEKLPFLIPPNHQKSADYWNSFASMCDAPVHLVTDELPVTAFQSRYWFDRPMFWLHDFENGNILNRILSASDPNPNHFVFCEDSSAFHRSDLCHRFVAAHNTASGDRFVRWLHDAEEVRFGPQSRLAI